MLGVEPHPIDGLSVDPIEGAVEDDLVLLGLRRLDRRFDVRVSDGKATVHPWMDAGDP
jgi:hypothetical protein